MRSLTQPALFAALVGVAALVSINATLAQTQEPSKTKQVEEGASKVVTSPLKDVGVVKDKIPEALIDARTGTYVLPSPLTCKTIFDAVDALGILRFVADLPVTSQDGCSRIGT